MTKVYLIRHAEAEGNLFRRAQGQFDGMVTALGRRQIEALRQRFLSIPVDAVYASDLRRARITAGAVAEPKGLAIQLSPRLREFGIGVWENVPWAEWAVKDPASMAAFNRLDGFSAPGSETPEEVRRRITAEFRRIAAENEGKTVAIVSHGMALRILLGALQGQSFEEMRSSAHSDNTAVSLVEVEGDFARIVFRDDNSHLGEALSTFAKQSWWRSRGGGSEPSLRFRAVDPAQDRALYLSLVRRAWDERHDPLARFSEEAYLSAAERLAAREGCAPRLALLENEPAGLVLPLRESCWFYLLPELRGRRLGIQLIGEAVAAARARGDDTLLCCCETEEIAAFLVHHGFSRDQLRCTLDIALTD